MKRLPPTESTAEAAARIGCSPPTVRKLISEGAIAGIKFGRSIRVLSESIDAFIRRMLWDSYVDAVYVPASCTAFEVEMLKSGVITRENLEKLEKSKNLKKSGRR